MISRTRWPATGLGYAYAKLNRVNEAREVLTEVVKIAGPIQQPAKDLLLKVNACAGQGKLGAGRRHQCFTKSPESILALFARV